MSQHAEQQHLQKRVEQFWDEKPCDSDVSLEEMHSPEYFTDIELQRYDLQSHIKDLLSSIDFKGKRVLEIGTGVGTDARTMIEMGAEYAGINVDAGSCNITSRALDVFGLSGKVQQASATEIPYPDASFDVVYSFGVLIVIPDVTRAVEEILRVLKPGGLLVVMLYNRSSINYVVEIKHLRKWGLRILGIPGMVALLTRLGLPRPKLERHLELRKSIGRMSDEEWLSRNTDGPDNPYARVYDRAETVELLSEFRDVVQLVRFFDYRHWGLVGRVLPAKLRVWLGSRWGWHRIVMAYKSETA